MFQQRWLLYQDPVLLCNDLGTRQHTISGTGVKHAGPVIRSSGHHSMSVKEAVRIAQTNNFMGLICSADLLVRLMRSLRFCSWTNQCEECSSCSRRIHQNCWSRTYHRHFRGYFSGRCYAVVWYAWRRWWRSEKKWDPALPRHDRYVTFWLMQFTWCLQPSLLLLHWIREFFTVLLEAALGATYVGSSHP